MTFFETLLVLLLVAVGLMQLAKSAGLPYPSMLVLAGVVIAFVPGVPAIHFEPATALALFIAPVIVDAAFDYPMGAARRFWVPLFVFAVLAVMLTTAVVAWVGHQYAGLPWPAAIALGAIVAPPDAAAATAVLGNLSLHRNLDSILKGESLFNDATALLIFSAALSVQAHGGMTPVVAAGTLLAIPGGVLFGWLAALAVRRIATHVSGTLRGSLLQFIVAYLLWVIAEHLQLSAVLTLVAFAMIMARTPEASASARNRLHSYAVWSTVVFVLNVCAFLLMGMQARTIIRAMPAAQLEQAAGIACLIVAAVVLVRFVVVAALYRYRVWRTRQPGQGPAASPAQAVVVGWCGMRGLVTLATAFALPDGFPQRDLVVLCAFAVVLGTLVIQGLTLTPLIRLLRLDQSHLFPAEIREARKKLLAAAMACLQARRHPVSMTLHAQFEMKLLAMSDPGHAEAIEARRAAALAVVSVQRQELERLRANHEIGADCFDHIQEELDWHELTLLPESERRIEQA